MVRVVGRSLVLLFLAAAFAGCLGGVSETDEVAAASGEQETSAVLASQRFEGELPAQSAGPQALSARHQIEAPEGVRHVKVTYNSSYTGAFPSSLHVIDPQGADAGRNLDSCPVALQPGIGMPYSCTVDVHSTMTGTWTLRLTWQVGEVAESYSLDASVMGVAGPPSPRSG